MRKEMIALREEQAKDIRAIRDVNEIAFGGPAEADVVDKLRQTCSELLSIVAVDGNEIVGHILFSPVTVESNDGVIRGMGLAPMVVLPKHQRKGVGTALIERGLALLRERAYPFVIVLGHAVRAREPVGRDSGRSVYDYGIRPRCAKRRSGRGKVQRCVLRGDGWIERAGPVKKEVMVK